MNFFKILLLLNFLPVLVLCFTPNYQIGRLRARALWFSLPPFLWSLCGYLFFNSTSQVDGGWTQLLNFGWLAGWQVPYSLGLDGVSLAFIRLTTFLIPICILASWETVRYRLRFFLLLLFTVEFCLVNAFGAHDLLIFYISFEAVVIPTFIIIGVWGTRLRRIGAAFRFFLYTLAGSLLMLVALLYLYLFAGSLHLAVLEELRFDSRVEILLWLAFFFSFAAKIPMVPLHVWLPEAHVEAPTAGSVLLAGILLKLGGYGFFRFSIPLFPEASRRLAPMVLLLSSMAIIYSSLATLVQVDLKKAIAYSSVAHMNYSTLGLFSLSPEGTVGALLLMISHGLVSSGLFLCVGFLYDRYGSRLLHYYGGLAQLMPLYSLLFFLLLLANLSMPGTFSFVAEFLVLVGAYKVNTLAAALATSGVILSAAYSIWLYNRLCFGPVSSNLANYGDLNTREISVLSFLVVLVFFFGLFPNPLITSIEVTARLPLFLFKFYKMSIFSITTTVLWPDMVTLVSNFFPFCAAILLLLLALIFTSDNFRSVAAILSWGVLLTLVLVFLLNLNSVSVFGFWGVGEDRLTVFFKILLALGGIGLTFVLQEHCRRDGVFQFEFYFLVLISISAYMMLIDCRNFLILYLSLELSSFCVYLMAAVRTSSLFAAESGLKYFLLGSLSSSLLLLGLSLLYVFFGSIEFHDWTLLFDNWPLDTIEFPVFPLFLVGAGLAFKLAIAPFHFWAPDVYGGAPLASTSFFAVLSKLGALALVVKILYTVFVPFLVDSGVVLLIFGVFSVVVGTFGALAQQRIKRLLAYSAIAHGGWIFLALGTTSLLGFLSVVLYILVYLLLSLNLFAILLSARRRADNNHLRSLEDLVPFSKVNPELTWSLAANFFSLAGIPPFAGFGAKLLVVLALVGSGYNTLAVLVVILAVVSAVYYLRIIRSLYFERTASMLFLRPVSVPMTIVVVSTTIVNTSMLFLVAFWSPFFFFL